MTHATQRKGVAVTVIALVATTIVLLASDNSRSPVHEERATEFQRLVGGLGGGPSVDLSQCAFNFDPRLCTECPYNHEAVPGAACFCPRHACSILYYPPLRPERHADGRLP